jgi:hypothetical protein
MTRSVHDNHLLGYEVDGVSRRIVLHTEYAYGQEPFEKTDVVFEGLVDHWFRHPVIPSIVFDVMEADARFLLTRDRALLDEGHRIGGWPSFWRDTVDGMLEAIAAQGGRMWEISSSYGLDGWVVAASCEFRAVEPEGRNDRGVEKGGFIG